VVLGVLETVAALVEAEPNADQAAHESLGAARQVRDLASSGRILGAC
jgi:hypothetical protein